MTDDGFRVLHESGGKPVRVNILRSFGVKKMERKIFEYQNGAVKVFADPEVLLRQISRGCDFDLDGVLDLCKSKNPAQSIPAIEKLLTAARGAFGMASVNGLTGEGCLDDEVDAVLNSFWDFLEKKNPSAGCLPMSRPAVEASPLPIMANLLASG